MRKRDYTVYLHINKVNKKVYVGITSMRVENRWREGAGTVSEYTKEKLRQYKGEKSSHPSKETIEKRISTRKALGHYSKDTSWLAPYRLRKGKESPMYGRKPSENTLLAHRKVILQFSLDGEFIKEFSSIKEASGEIGISKPAIVHCLKGKTKKAGGYKWKYKYE
jgi:hypothetical protein